ncbi:MAG TPA: MBL fold metallo-hydrolase [Thermoanaerobaculia bacterium]|nr:MBL fold metallo-hydrolase [Thermoanaerobaculia bacterium]
MTDPKPSPAHALPLRPAASSIIICRGDGRDGSLRLLWVRRSEANPFLGGFHSFPGGRHAREDGNLGTDEAENLRIMARCAARETFEETGLLLGFKGRPPGIDAQRRVRTEVLAGELEFWPTVATWGLELDYGAYVWCGRWITPHFSRARFNTNFFMIDLPDTPPTDVWPGELESGGWIDPREAARLWDGDQIVLAMPTLYTIRVLAEGGHDLPARLHAIPEANGVASRHVDVRPAITMTPLKTETIPPASHTNAVVVGDGDVVVIDPGSADAGEQDALDAVVRNALGPGGKVRAILLTHEHRDHVAGVEAARARYGAPVWAHAGVGARVRLDRTLREGDVIELPGRHARRLRVLETPGHSRAHVIFHEETSRTAVVGDLVSGLGTVVIDPPDGNLSDYLASLERLRALDLLTIVPGHGPPNRGVGRLIDALVEHRRMREGRILHALAGGPLALEELRARAYADTPDADPRLAARTLAAHLEKLEAEAQVVVENGSVKLAAAQPS